MVGTKAVVDMRFVDIYVDRELTRHVDKDFRMSSKMKKNIRKPSRKNTKIRNRNKKLRFASNLIGIPRPKLHKNRR